MFLGNEGDDVPELPSESLIQKLIFAVLAVILFLLLVGCVNAPVAPNLKIPEAQPACPKLALPPVPQKVFLQIDGDKIMSDAGGGLLLRGYVRSRSLLR